MESEEVYLVPGQLRGCIADDAGSLRHVRLANQVVMLRLGGPLVVSELSGLVQSEVVLACGPVPAVVTVGNDESPRWAENTGGLREKSVYIHHVGHSLDADHDVEGSIREACLTRISVAKLQVDFLGKQR